MREIVHLQAGQCGNQIGAKVKEIKVLFSFRNEEIVFLRSWQEFMENAGRRGVGMADCQNYRSCKPQWG